ncbi:MAG: ATP-binding protein [Methanomassiliicoccaceae archaeon]|nr:ATP-binding protein [Methanomassiliicoccaceae archaeon]
MAKIINRERYLDRLLLYKDKPLVKAITGIRRCGKSTLMRTFIDRLVESGVPKDRILYMKFDTFPDSEIDNDVKLWEEVSGRIEISKGSYLLFDEIQDIAGWEKKVNMMYEAGADVYITGSNTRLLRSESSTYLTGRTYEVKMYPLSFREYLEFGIDRRGNLQESLKKYKMNGGFPFIALFEEEIGADSWNISSGIYDSILVNDIIERYGVRDVSVVKNIFRFLMKNTGNQTSVRSISNYLTSNGEKTHHQTIDTYLGYLESAYLVYRAKKYDIKAREYLRTSDKFYAADIGMRNGIVGFNYEDQSGLLENIVFLELLARGSDVSVVSVGGGEIDFVVDKGGNKQYYQVTDNLYSPETIEREVRSLLATGDNYPKTIITDKPFELGEIRGIRVISLIDFLLEDLT